MKIVAITSILSAFCAWWATDTWHDLQAAKVQAAGLQTQLKSTTDVISDFNKSVAKQKEVESAKIEINAALRDLRTDVAGVRSATKRIESGSLQAITEYATTCRAVFAAVVEAGETLSIEGARIAAEADGHAIDAAR